MPEIIRQHAIARSADVAIRELGDGENITATVTYAQLADSVEQMAATLDKRTGQGDRVIVLVRRPALFVPTFLACLRTGRIAVPLALPSSPNAALSALRLIIRASAASAVLTDLSAVVAPLLADHPGLPVLDVTERYPGATGPAALPSLDDIAFLQFTSGSTGSPRGVVVRHGNLMANQEQIRSRFEQDEDAVVVSWLPMYHDMGLIGAVLHPLYLGATAVLMPPEAFLERPARWLRAISRFGGTVSPAPNFAFDLCTARIRDEELGGVDLSTWNVACNGAEPVRAATLRAFTARFAPHGFDPSAMSPAYGLAEATLMVSAVPRGTEPGLRQGRVSCGVPVCEVRVVASGGGPAAPGEIGEIEVRGANVTDGYWDPASATAAADEHWRPEGWMTTGDLGFLEKGELYVSGRIKDVVIVRGRNLYSHDIEDTAQSASALLRRGDGAVVQDGDAVVLVQGLRDAGRAEEAARLVRAAVVRAHGVTLDSIVFVAPGSVPKTTSGKIRRSESLRLLREGKLEVLAVSGDGTPEGGCGGVATDRLAGVVREFLRLPGDLDVTGTPLVALGLDSLRAVQLKEELRERLAIDVTIADLLAAGGVADLAAACRPVARAAGPAGPQPLAGGELPFAPATAWERIMWAVQRRNPASTAYVIARRFVLDDTVEVPALLAAFDALVAARPHLSSVYRLREGSLIREPGIGPTARHQRADDAMAAAERAATEPIDLSAGPLIALDVFTDDGCRVLLLRVHHILADMTSAGVLAGELLALAAGGAGVPDGAPVFAPEPQTPDPAELAAWRAEFADATPLWLPTAASSATEVGAGRVRWATLSPTALDQVDAIAVRNRTTRAGVLLAFEVLWLARLSDQDTVSLAVPLSLRTAAAEARIPGYAVNTLPLVVTIDENGSFDDLVVRCAAAQLRALALRGVPLTELVGDAGTAARAGEAMRCLFGYLEDHEDEVRGLAGVALQEPGTQLLAYGARMRLEPLPISALAPIDLAYAPSGDGLVGRLVLAADMFDDDHADLLTDALSQIHAAALAQPGRALRELTVKRAGFTEPQPPAGPSAGTLADRWHDQVATRPGDTALVTARDSFTYEQLDQGVRDVAARLGKLGRAPVAALLIGDRDRMVPAVLASHVRGAAVLPLGTASPNADLRFMIEDAGAEVLLADEELAPRARQLVAECARPPRVELLPDLATLVSAGRPSEAFEPVSADAVAYIVYTSGSTGTPKGVPITHANVLPLLDWQVGGLGAGPRFRLIQTLALTFDFGLQELWTPLLYGGTLVMPPDHVRSNAGAYLRFVTEHEINALFVTPSFARELMTWGQPMPTVRLFVLGGELLTYELVDRIVALLPPGAVVINGYGPTEASINCAMQRVEARRCAAVVPVGVPTGASTIRLLDRLGRRVPPGAVGEVVIGGPGVASGYLGLAAETAERFVDAPEPGGGRLYRSGDRAMWTAGGELVILGRADGQAKVSGFRIEVGEVEARLRALDGVRDAAVVVDRRGGTARLAAFVVAPGADLAALRQAAVAGMPPHMRPELLCAVTALARTAHGKLDVDALLAVADDRRRTRARDPLDVVLDAWRDVLGVDVEPDDTFFELGGHSLAVTQVMSRIQAALDLPGLPLSLFFEHVTPRRLAGHLAALVDPAPARTPSLATARKRRGLQRRHRPS
ncbi:non-ribosomal peptide synthetase [Streptosporangium canum]|uniref:non-ribosomal peptide synthetase n=1 Tax=Streptosporangium canum TaxID=324952 RepID=UPI001C43055C|nr:non-ribosomal peptide synthetase [Streptosporangium canum]